MRYLLHRRRWLCLAIASARLPTLEDRLSLLSLLALGRNMGEGTRCPARTRAGTLREEPPAQSAAIADSQSLKTTGVGGGERGYDGGKKVKGTLSAICWSIRRVWCSKLGSTARRWKR